MKKYVAKDFGYKGDEFLMNPPTGSVETADSWASEAHLWDEEDKSIEEQFESLVEVKQDEEGNWVEV